eukprot:scaffold272785_cov33-Tisochrysis_lutea.AAC.2
MWLATCYVRETCGKRCEGIGIGVGVTTALYILLLALWKLKFYRFFQDRPDAPDPGGGSDIA